MVIKTKVWPAKKGTVSLRSTIPEAVVESMSLKAGDELVWEMKTVNRQERIRARLAHKDAEDFEQAVLVRKVST